MSTVIQTDEQPGTRPERRPTGRTVLMCRPEHFTVVYRINPWMNPAEPTDTELAAAAVAGALRHVPRLGYDVQLIDPIQGLPDMVYAANGGFVIDNIAYGAKFTHPERQPEGPAYMDWFRAARLRRARARGDQRGRGRLPARRRHDPRRHRLPQRLAVATRSSAASSAARS